MQRSILALITGSLLLGLAGAATKVQSQSLALVSPIAWQGQSVSRWQEERFGPIVSTDTLWTISTYYGQKQGISIYAMMDLIVAANPRVFINGDPDRMMDGYFLTIPNLARGASATTNDTRESSAGDAAVDNTAIETPDPVATAVDAAAATLSAEEMDNLRSNLAESIALIENLQQENVDLQERLRAVNAELAELKQRVDSEGAAAAELRQLTDEVTAIANAAQASTGESTNENVTSDDATSAREDTAAEAVENESRTDETMSEESLADVDASESAADEDAAAIAAPTTKVETAAVEPVLNVDEDVTKEVEVATTAKSEPSQRETMPSRGSSNQKAPSFIDWLMQPYQLALAILVPLLLAAIIWYVIYVRRVNREIAGTYTGARQAAERDNQAQIDESEATSDEAVEIDGVSDDTASDDTAADEEPYQQENDAPVEPTVDDPLWSDTDADANEFDIEVVASETPEQELDEASDADIEAALADLSWSLDDQPAADAGEASDGEPETGSTLESLSDLELEPVSEPEIESEPEPELESASEPESELHATKDDESTSTHDLDLIDIETLLEEADADANDDVEDRYSTDDVKDVLGESNEPVMPSGTDLEDDFELGKSPATLLDLAQAYIEMGEMEDARILLNKIKHCGDDDIEREVAQLLQNLDGPSHR